ncbi:HutP protein [Caldanaerobius fijiensis DSM 17918]|uniref:Hut operon positive regulatory protein n=1 Tax=Caldanaerobius fijiensis DSM 17918 TaxID=1121256 RepID=A0A1M4XYQ1_9THEO|nr:HutP family protein [Caldanaerobius fijiensis]SHE98476.1 HutP protein [Caldanaerobius fijiensis DSM 17918]
MKSIDVAKVAIKMAISSREEEELLKQRYKERGIKAVAVDFGGDFNGSIKKILERAAVAARREGVVEDTHVGEGAIVGVTREALSQIAPKAFGLNVGGKIGIARWGEHLSVAIFFEIGLLNLNEVAIGLAHRSLPV